MFRYLHDCSDCFRLERIAGWALHPLESAAFSRRTPIPAISSVRYQKPQELRSVPTRILAPRGGPALRLYFTSRRVASSSASDLCFKVVRK